MDYYKILIVSILINLIFIILFYIIYKNGFSKKCKDYPIYKKILFSDLIKNAKSGDLLLFSNSRCNVITRTFGNPYYSHIGIIVKKNNKLFSLELVKDDNVYPKKNRYKGLICIPLDDRILYYSGYVYHCKLNKKLDNIQENKLIEYTNKKIKYSYTQVCSFWLANVLEDLNIRKNLNSWKFWNIHNNIIKMCNNTIYSNPILIVHDKLLIKNTNDNKLMNYC